MLLLAYALDERARCTHAESHRPVVAAQSRCVAARTATPLARSCPVSPPLAIIPASTLLLSLEVVTLAHFGSPEFIMRVAAASDSELPCSCSILTEDGRHYRTFLRPDEPASN